MDKRIPGSVMWEGTMIRMMVVVIVAGLASAAVAGGNPEVSLYVSFDPTGAPVHTFQAEPYTSVRAYICVANVDEGVGAVALKLSDALAEYPGVVATQSFVFQWPG